MKTLDYMNETVAIPTPALSEFLVHSEDDGSKYLAETNGSSRFKIVDFDPRGAVEAAVRLTHDRKSGDKKGGSSSPWQKVKVDRQRVAIAKVSDVRTIYTDDSDVKGFAERLDIRAIGVVDLPLPTRQGNLFEK